MKLTWRGYPELQHPVRAHLAEAVGALLASVEVQAVHPVLNRVVGLCGHLVHANGACNRPKPHQDVPLLN